jgi:hypothetical protein
LQQHVLPALLLLEITDRKLPHLRTRTRTPCVTVSLVVLTPVMSGGCGLFLSSISFI